MLWPTRTTSVVALRQKHDQGKGFGLQFSYKANIFSCAQVRHLLIGRVTAFILPHTSYHAHLRRCESRQLLQVQFFC